MTVPRSWLIRLEVAGASGAVAGMTWVTSTVGPVGVPVGAAPAWTAATPGTALSARSSRSSAARSAADWVWATTNSGPLKPGPNALNFP